MVPQEIISGKLHVHPPTAPPAGALRLARTAFFLKACHNFRFHSLPGHRIESRSGKARFPKRAIWFNLPAA